MKKSSILVAALALMATSLAYGVSIKVNQPTGGNLCFGKTEQITWTVADYSGKVKIMLLKGGVMVGTIANDVNALSLSYSWQVGAYIGGTAGAGSDYRIRVRAMTEDVKGHSGGFNITKCDIGNPPPPPPPDNLPKKKTPVELMQKPPTIQQPTAVNPPNSIVISQLSPPKIVQFHPDKQSIGQGGKITFTIQAENVTQAALFDDVRRVSFFLDDEIKQNKLNLAYQVAPKQGGAWRLVVSNLSGRSEAKQLIQVIAPPTIVLFKLSNPNMTRFSAGTVVPVEIQVANAERVSIIRQYPFEMLKQYPVPAGQVDFMPTFDWKPEHTSEIFLKAENKAGSVISEKIRLENQMETPYLSNIKAAYFTDWDNLVVDYQVRGPREYALYSKYSGDSDTPGNWTKEFHIVSNGGYTGDSVTLKKPGPLDLRLVVNFWDGSSVTDQRNNIRYQP